MAFSGCLFIPVTISDTVGDADLGYFDITRATIHIWVIDGIHIRMNLAFSIQVREPIGAPLDVSRWGFLIDSDRNSASGMQYHGMGANHWVEAVYVKGWYASIWAWRVGKWEHVADAVYEIAVSAVTIYVNPPHIGSPSTFDFIAFTYVDEIGFMDSAPDTGFATMPLYQSDVI